MGVKLTQEQLNAIISEQVQNTVKTAMETAGGQMTEGVKAMVDEQLKSILKDNLKIKYVIGDPDPDDPTQQPGADPKGGFKCLSEYAIAVRAAGKGQVDKRLVDLESKAAADGMNEADAEYGAYLLPVEFRNTLLEVAVNQSNIINLAFRVPMAINAIEIPYLSGFDRSTGLLHGGVQFKWLDEAAEITGTRPKLGKVGLRLKKAAGMAYMTSEIIEDSPITMEPLLTRAFADALTWELDENFLNGVGGGRPLGVVNAPCLISVAAETNQSAATIIFENVTKAYSRMWNKANAIWMANDDCFTQLASISLAVGTGGVPVWLPAGGVSGKPYDTLMGKPLVFTEHCQTVGTLGDLLFCDWSQYLIGQKAGVGAGTRFDTSIHLKFDYDQTAFRFIFRIDGQPWWPTALTPRHSSNTLSPFVGIATRA